MAADWKSYDTKAENNSVLHTSVAKWAVEMRKKKYNLAGDNAKKNTMLATNN